MAGRITIFAFRFPAYQLLNAYKESPQLPNGYPAMVILTLIPPIWFKVMNKRLEEWQHLQHG